MLYVDRFILYNGFPIFSVEKDRLADSKSFRGTYSSLYIKTNRIVCYV